LDNVLVTETFGKGMSLSRLGMEDDLSDTGPVSQIDEDDPAMVTVIIDPPGQADGFADVFLTE